jgi:F420-dependent oxidoreductase-like protein
VQLGYAMGYAPPGTNPRDLIELAQEAERLGYGSAWAAEAWGTDAVTVLSWLAAVTSTIEIGTAIMQIPGRTPANTAMTAATLDLLSGGRFLLGLGTSGPQIVEGWHGQQWGKPLTRTREYVEIVRRILRREALQFDGDQYSITPHGKPLKLMMRPLRNEIPVYLAALSPKNVRLAFEIADGWLPVFFSPERALEAFEYEPREGFEIAPTAHTIVTDDEESAREFLKPLFALYVGGMGSREVNFYNRLMRRYGYEEEAERIQELYLAGKQLEAIAAVPDSLVDEVALVGSPEKIRDRLDAWRESGVTRLLVSTHDLGTLRALAEIAL